MKVNSIDAAVLSAAANIYVDEASQAVNTIVLKAVGTKPTVAIPIILTALNDFT
jgi:hypothetical protein